MKKLLPFLFTFISLIAVAGQLPVPAHTGSVHSEKSNQQFSKFSSSSNLRTLSCDTISNQAASDILFYYFPMDTAAAAVAGGRINGLGYFDGNGALAGPANTFYTILNIAEKFDAPAATGQYVTSAIAFFSYVHIKPTTADSAKLVTAYVYDTTGTAANGHYQPGNAIDSATATLGFIATYSGAIFNFTHQSVIPGRGFFIDIKLPQVAGDTIVVAYNDGTSGSGHAWFQAGIGALTQWLPVDSFIGQEVGSFITARVCGNVTSCPTITTTATQISGSSAKAVVSGGASPYTYSWSNGQTTDTASGLVTGTTYHVTATDHNGCTSTGSVTIIPTGIGNINAGVSNFSVYPNPSNGTFTASVNLESAGDVTISVVDMTGKKMFESTDKSVKELTKPINLSAIAAGVYIVNVKTENGSVNQRIVIK